MCVEGSQAHLSALFSVGAVGALGWRVLRGADRDAEAKAEPALAGAMAVVSAGAGDTGSSGSDGGEAGRPAVA